MADYKTYAGWIGAGRAVRTGERAEFYLADPARTVYRAVFELGQTRPYEEDLEQLTDLVPASERPKASKPDRPLVKIDYDTKTQRVAVWVGSNKGAIKQLKDKSGFQYNPTTHRWTETRADIHKVRKGMEQFNRVELKIDGELWRES